MTFKYIDGFEWLDSTDVTDLDQLWTLSQIAMTVETGRQGGSTQAVRFANANSADFMEKALNVVDVDNDFQYFGFAIKISALPGAVSMLLGWYSAGNTLRASLRIGTAGEIILYQGSGTGTVVLTSVDTLQPGVWHHIEVGFRTVDASVSAGAIIAIDGGTPVAQAGDERIFATNDATKYRFGKDQTGFDMDIDDFFYNFFSSIPSYTLALIGDSQVTMLVPDAETTTEWAIGGSVPAATNFQSVDEAIGSPHDAGVTLVTETVAAQDDLYGVAAAGLDAGATVHAVAVNVVGDKDGLDVTTLVDGPSAVVEAGGAPVGLGSGTYNHKQHIHETYDSSPWTVSDVNALEVGIRST